MNLPLPTPIAPSIISMMISIPVPIPITIPRRPSSWIIRPGIIHLPPRTHTSPVLLHRQQPIPIKLAFMYALRHTQVPEERKEVERVAEGDGPFEDGTDVGGLVEGDSEGDGEEDEDAGDDAFDAVGGFEFANFVEVVADPAVLQGGFHNQFLSTSSVRVSSFSPLLL